MIAVIGYALYEIFVLHIVDSKNIFRAILIFAGLVISFLRIKQGRTAKMVSPTQFRERYPDILGNVFTDDRAMEKRFFKAVNLWNRNEQSSALDAFGGMEALCRKNDERYAVAFFKGLCYDDLHMWVKAAEQYERALTYRENSSAASNMGIAYERLGKEDEAESAYRYAVRIDPDNEYPYNNLAQLCIRRGEYEDAADYARQATQRNANFRQAWSALAVSCAMLGYEEDYERAYQRAVACGADGESLRRYIRFLTDSD